MTAARSVATPKIWRYQLPYSQTSDGGTFVLDETGFFAATSAYGGYAYRWSAFGPSDFRAFVAQLDASYLYGKLHRDRRSEPIDEDAIRHAVRKYLWEHREDFDPDVLQEERALITDAELDHQTGLDDWLRETTIEDPWTFCATRPERECWAFCTRLMPRLQRRLRFDVAKGGRAP